MEKIESVSVGDWYAPLRELESLGANDVGVAHQGELAAARRRHLGQFFTPANVARFMWGFVDRFDPKRKVSVFDNSVGSGRLLQFADPERHSIFAVDVHGPSIMACQSVFEAAGFTVTLKHAGMEDLRPANFDLALINPPFSLHLESPHLHAFDCTTWGRYGANKSATSHEYALAQALNCAKVVVALLPLTFAEEVLGSAYDHNGRWFAAARRLAGFFELPDDAFKVEGASVRTAVLVFDRYRDRPSDLIRQPADLSQRAPFVGLHWEERAFDRPKLGIQTLDDSTPVITRAVTGGKNVTIAHDGRRIVLGFECGFIEAMVMNTILEKRIFSQDGHRLPQGFRYAGQGMLDLETYYAQDCPVSALHKLTDRIRAAGGQPVYRAGFHEHFARGMRRSQRQATPLRHVVYTSGAGSAEVVTGLARATHKVDERKWGSPLIREGDELEFRRDSDGRYAFQLNGVSYGLAVDELNARFVVQNVSQGWEVVHEGLAARYPDLAKQWRDRVVALGIDKWLDWEFQVSDLSEIMMKPSGSIVAWEMALGKSRLALALILLSNVKHGLIVVESRLIREMLAEISRLPIDMNDVHVIQDASDIDQLARFNLIAYERLRMPVDRTKSKRVTYAHRLRRRIGLLVADEGERLANPTSDQSRALWQLSARRRFVLTGSPIPSYPRDAFGLVAYTGGDGTAAQPYGYRRGYLEPAWLNSVEHAVRGIDRFRDDFVVTEWVTWEFAESLQDGAKREVPKIGNLSLYRQMLAPQIKRRLICEPEVARHIQVDEPVIKVHEIDWESSHLSLYLRAADDFAQWYSHARRDEAKSSNLITILARLRAVHFAANYPQYGMEGIGTYAGVTTKQEAVLTRLREIAAEGKQAIVFAENPGVLNLMARTLGAEGIETVLFHGEVPITKRVRDKDERFLTGKATALLSTKASGRAGYNLPNADYVLFYDRSWTYRSEYQAMRRALRWNRQGTLTVEYFHLPGSIDVYQAQMVAHKKDSMQAGLDWATPELDDEAFLHIDTLLDSFVEDLAKMRGMSKTYEMRQRLKEAA
ncbi:helicase-related protein [Paraburkholderia domus]|uniref:helicase-related protein n=1 Tax=Paraburkholderia domus TaxID=2793075 RepID=UPI001912CC41|nr:helicase-related protein [Paraburkholderia domus]MBK5064865.1 N-6 DNA methylase [Burkholderia sp. R-70199]CAE6967741.1 hypothetical protein R70199_07879 [Paraburkholderia domus]